MSETRETVAEMPTVLAVIEQPNTPAFDRGNLSVFDERWAALLNLAAQRGVVNGLNTIAGQRRRMYNERDEIWHELQVYGEPLATVADLPDNETARTWLLDKLGEQARATIDDKLGVGSQPDNREEPRDFLRRYIRPTTYYDHFNAWVSRNGLTSRNEELINRARGLYKEWLVEQTRPVRAEVAEFLARPDLAALRGDIKLSAEHASRTFHGAVFADFDKVFRDRIEKGIIGLEQTESLGAPEGVSRWRWLGRTAAQLHATSEQNAKERPLLKDFMGIAQDMTRIVSGEQTSQHVQDTVQEFKRVNGIDALETYIRRMVQERLTQTVGTAARETFFAQFEDEVEDFFAHFTYHSAHRQWHDEDSYFASRTHKPDAPRWEAPAAAAGPEEALVIMHGYTSSSLSFDGSVLQDETSLIRLLEGFAEAQRERRIRPAIERVVVFSLCQEMLADADADGDELFAKRAARRTLMNFHTDKLQVADKKQQAEQQAQAASAGALFGLVKEGRIILDIKHGRASIALS